ncbi:extracellular solute-binding protein [Paenibacillus sp. ACRRX]|uniref:extracellular solute-binding protein n=1 Tax=Paenibacillus sp. ACRRX TaxID=2918206 RepID=UPI001EF4FACD
MVRIRRETNYLFISIYLVVFIGLFVAFFPKFAPIFTGVPSNKTSHGQHPVSIVINSLSFTYPDGLDENHNPYLTYIEEQTGLNIDVYMPPVTSYEDTLHTLISSDTNLPDMLSIYSKVRLSTYVQQNKLMPLEDWIEKYGPDLKRVIPQEAWDQVTFDGHIYAIPSSYLVNGNELMYVRQDWLDKLKLPRPVTLNDYKRVIKAFTTNDPDGNGKHDTYGLSMLAGLQYTSPLFGAFGIQLNQWTERNGELVFANTLPEMKEALSFFKELYQEKWIDPYFPLHTRQTMLANIEHGKIGLFAGAWYDTRGAIANNIKKDPKARWVSLDYPVGKNGKQGVEGSRLVHGYQVITRGSDHSADVIRLLNFIAGKGRETLILGFEHQVWTRKNGEIITNFKEHDKHLYRGIYSSLVNVHDPKLQKMRLDSYGKHYQLYDNIQRVEKHAVRDLFWGPSTPTMQKKWNALNEMQYDFINIIVGVEPIESFDAYVGRWRMYGGSQITKEVNAWYKTVPQRVQQ